MGHEGSREAILLKEDFTLKIFGMMSPYDFILGGTSGVFVGRRLCELQV